MDIETVFASGLQVSEMRSIFIIFLVILTATETYSSSPALIQNADVPRFGETELAKLAKGEVIVRADQFANKNEGRVQTAILIDSSARQIWDVMIDCDRAPEFVPGLKSCMVLQSNRNTKIIEHQVKSSWLLPMVTYIFQENYEEFMRIDFKRIRGDLKAFEGSWVLEEVNGGKQTIVVYSVFLDPGFWVPKSLIRQKLRKTLPNILLALRDRVSELSQ